MSEEPGNHIPDEQDGSRTAVPHQRVGAYAIVVAKGAVLLTELSEQTPLPGRWGLPGGGVQHGEAPLDAVVREVREETGHELCALRLFDVASERFTARAPSGRLEDFHHIQVVYTADVVQVRPPQVLEIDGSTSQARWVPLDELADLPLLPRTARCLAARLASSSER